MKNPTSKKLLGQLGLDPCCVVQHVVALICGFRRPSEPRRPTGFAPVFFLLAGRAVGEGLPILALGNCDRAGFGGRR